MNKALIIFCISFLVFTCASSIKLNFNKDDDSHTGIYIPKDIKECHSELDKLIPKSMIRDMKNGSLDNMATYHHGLGTWIRNNWGLWNVSRLKKYLERQGFIHPDDMSKIILDTYWCHLNSKCWDYSEYVEYYKLYWAKSDSIQKEMMKDNQPGKAYDLPDIPKPKPVCE
jgi:hypothetical protein